MEANSSSARKHKKKRSRIDNDDDESMADVDNAVPDVKKKKQKMENMESEDSANNDVTKQKKINDGKENLVSENSSQINDKETGKKSSKKDKDQSEKDETKSKSVKVFEIASTTEPTKEKKSKKRKKSKVKNSLRTVDNKLVENAKKNLQVNGVNVEGNDDSERTDEKDAVSDEKKIKENKFGKTPPTNKKPELEKVNTNERALNYLRKWNTDRESWKFNKMQQTDLLHVIYDADVVNEEDFQTLLLYLSGLKGKAKEITHDQAMKFIDGDAKKGEEISEDKEQRAREIVQALS